MASRDPTEPAHSGDPLDDELLGLDLADPEARAFAEHLSRMRRNHPRYTIEGYLDGVADFADSANRANGTRRLGAVVLVVALLAVTALLIMDSLGFVLTTPW